MEVEREFEGMKKESICVFLLHTPGMPHILHLDVWTRVNAENVSVRHM